MQAQEEQHHDLTTLKSREKSKNIKYDFDFRLSKMEVVLSGLGVQVDNIDKRVSSQGGFCHQWCDKGHDIPTREFYNEKSGNDALWVIEETWTCTSMH